MVRALGALRKINKAGRGEFSFSFGIWVQQTFPLLTAMVFNSGCINVIIVYQMGVECKR